MKKLAMVCLLACLSSAVAAQSWGRTEAERKKSQAALKLCEDIEHAATTGAFKGLSHENFMELFCDILVADLTLDNVGACHERATRALRKAYAADHAPQKSWRLDCSGLPCSCRVTFE